MSHVTVIERNGKSKRIVHSAPRLLEAPNWSADGKHLVLNSEGKLWRVAVEGGEPGLIPTGTVKGINNDHGVSPDGKTLVYCARREGNFDIYSISVDGGTERRLTTSPGYDDGPEYSPDGKWIYFNSDRAGGWDIWRIPSEGAGTEDAKAERVTSDELEDWFPHPSPNGRWLVFLSFPKGTMGHPANQNVVLRRMRLPGAKPGRARIREIVRLFGGQGTINVGSWSPDSRRFAYVSYSFAK